MDKQRNRKKPDKAQQPSSGIPEEEMSFDLKLACCDLQCEMLIASQRLAIDDLLIGANDAFIKGFWTGWKYRGDLAIGWSEIYGEVMGKN